MKDEQLLAQDLGLSIEIINNDLFYTYADKSTYYRITFVYGMHCFIIEGGTKEEAEKNIVEDWDLFSIGLGKQQILKEIREWFIEYCINDK